jgi:hypothetical protein
LFAFEVGAGGGVVARLRDRDSVERGIQLAVAAPVESVPLALARARLERCDTAVAGKLSVALEAADRADLGQQLRRRDRAAAGQLE